MKVLIIEDEAAATRRLRKMLGEIDQKTELVSTLDSIEASIAWFNDHPSPDLIFLDIHLADGSGFELFRHVDLRIPVIFTTAYDQYAIEAFKVNAVDYLLKPIKKTELSNALNKFRLVHPEHQPMDYSKLIESLLPKPQKRFLVRIGSQIKVIQAQDIAYFYTLNKITYAVDHSGKKYPIDDSLDQVESTLDDHSFFRINRQFIVGFQAIQQMHAYSKSRVKIELDPACEIETIVSTERSPKFKKWLVGE